VTQSGPGKTYPRDAEGRLKSVDLDGADTCSSGAAACYVYNAFGQRVGKLTGSTVTEYMYDVLVGLAQSLSSARQEAQNRRPCLSGLR